MNYTFLFDIFCCDLIEDIYGFVAEVRQGYYSKCNRTLALLTERWDFPRQCYRVLEG